MATEPKTARSRRTRAALISAIHERLRRTGTFTATEIANDVGCSPSTFWAHFENKDDAITCAFQEALDEMIPATERHFGAGPDGLIGCAVSDRVSWAAKTVDDLISHFTKHEFLYRLALARLPEHRPLRQALRTAETTSIEVATGAMRGDGAPERAAAIICLCQGVNNSILLHSALGDLKRHQISIGLASMTVAHT